MFKETNTDIAPWIIIKANRKTEARIEAIEQVLDIIPYKPKDKTILTHLDIDQPIVD